MIRKQPSPHEWATTAQAEAAKRKLDPGVVQWIYAVVKKVATQERARAVAIVRKVEEDYPPQVFSDPTPPMLAHICDRVAKEIEADTTEVEVDDHGDTEEPTDSGA